MRVLSRGTLNDFVTNRVAANLQKSVREHLSAWFAEAEEAKWQTPAELRQQFRSASIVGHRVVFNIRGNDYRLVVEINYALQILFIKWMGTHSEYDRIDVAMVKYDKARYK